MANSPEFDRGELVALIQLLRALPHAYTRAFVALPSAERKLRILLAELTVADAVPVADPPTPEPEKPRRGRPRKSE